METSADRKVYRADVGRFLFGFAVRAAVVFVGFLWALFCVKTVIVECGEVRIKRVIGRGRIYPLTDYTFDSYIKLGSRTFKWEKRYLKIEDHYDSVKKIYLPFFGTGTYSALISAIRAEDTELIPQEIRSEIAYENLVGEDSYYLVPKAKIVRAERKRFGIMVLSIPVEFIRMLANMRRCPERFKKSGNFLFVDEKGFSLSRIEQIFFTDAKAVSYSIYPKYRYMRIKTEDGIYKYCLGSAFSMLTYSYVNLCCGVEELFINDAMKVVYLQK